MTMTERPTAVARLTAGPVEYRLERRGEAAVVILHGGHMRAGLALGEEVFGAAGYTVLVPSRPGYGQTRSSPAPVRAALPTSPLTCVVIWGSTRSPPWWASPRGDAPRSPRPPATPTSSNG
ncbi:hypothetical protein [Nonomuraea endophytica]|uniref:hypothetical protein n=1 Tax=Nonomuraea endophytica TaxID=714136 RepID=UPI0037C53AD5